MGGGTGGPEMALISESCANANARIRFFRVAFGAAAEGQMIGRRDVVSILEATSKGGRLRYDWGPPGDMERAEVQLALLALLCAETALPRGGLVSVDFSAGRWRILAQGSAPRIDPEVWGALTEPGARKALAPAHVQFALLPQLAEARGRHTDFAAGEESLRMTV